MTVTADDLRHAYSWDDLATVIDLARAPALPMPLAAPPPPTLPPAPVAPRPKAPRPRLVPVTPMRQATAKSMTKLADSMKESHPEMTVHQHVRDAARMLRTGNEEAAQRHLRAAMYSLSPQSIYRHGITTDDGHIQARQALHGVHRHLLLVKDIVDVGEKNRAAIARHAAEDDTGSPAPPDPNAGYGPGALAQKPTQRQPGGDRALNAPDRTNSGGSDPAGADPVGPQPKGSRQFARSWDELVAVIELASRPKAVELVGPKGYIHGWIYVDDVPGLPSVAEHNAALRKKGVTPPTKAHPALTRKPPGVKNTAPKTAAGKAAAAARSRAALAKVNQAKSPAEVPSAASAPPAGLNTAGALKPGDKIMGAFKPGTGPSAHTVVSAKADGKTVHLTVKDSAGNTYKSDIGAGEDIVRAPAAKVPAAGAALSGDAAFGSVKRPGNLTLAEKGALSEYGEPAGYKTTNPYLFHNGQVFDSSTMSYRPATTAEKKLAKTVISGMDSAFTKAEPLKQDIVTYRRMGDTDAMFGKGSAVGKTVKNLAYTSTTTAPGAQTGFGFGYSSKSGNIEVHIPAGSKVMPGNNFEHEVLLPRGAGFRVTKDETTPDGQRNIVMTYDPGAVPDAKAAPSAVPAKAAAPAEKAAAPAVKQEAAPGAGGKAAAPAMSADEAAAAAKGAEAEKQAEGISMLGQMGGKSTQLAVIKKKPTGELQAADYGFQQRAAEKGHPDKVTAAHQMVREEIAKRGGTLADLTQGARMKSAGEIAAGQRKDLMNAWSTSYRYKGTTEAKSPRRADFAKEMHRLLSTNKPPAKCGLGCQDAHKFLGMIDAEAKPQPKELQRGLTLSPAAAERMFQPGKTMDMPTASWTNDPATGAEYAKGDNPSGRVKVLLHAAPGAKGMDISAESLWHGSASDPGISGGGEAEVVTGGRFSVQSVKTEGGVMNVYLTQQDFAALANTISGQIDLVNATQEAFSAN